jgi:hypothetical protein
MAQGDGSAPYTVRMYPWASVTGRLVDENGNDLPVYRPENDWQKPPKISMSVDDDPKTTKYAESERGGYFKVDQLIPGQPYTVTAYKNHGQQSDTVAEDVILRAGEIRELGELRTELPYEVHYRTTTRQTQHALAHIPEEAWGEPVDGLRAAIVPQSPAVDENEQFLCDIVIENVSDGEVRFTIAIHALNNFSQVELADADGNLIPRQHGAAPGSVNAPRLERYRLEPGERVELWRSGAQLVQLDASGQPTPAAKPVENWVAPAAPSESDRPAKRPNRNLNYGYFNIAPGRYAVSADVQLGSLVEHVDQASGTRTARSPLPGEWTGKLRTGVVEVSLFDGAGE